MDFHQFYPTPVELARRAWAKFQNKNFIRVLEPSAGEGDFVTAMPYWESRYGPRVAVDVIEIDVTKHPILREKGLNVIGLDFMQFQNGAAYSHVLLNPPFSQGADHVLKAWDVIWEAEIVAIINAETLRNPFSKERQRLVYLVEQFGSVEYIRDAFKGENVRREANVEIALIYLKKEANLEQDIFGGMLDDLTIDPETGAGLSGGYQQAFDVSLPKTEIETRVATFNAAVTAMKDSVMLHARASHYANLIGRSMAEMMSGQFEERRDTTADYVRNEISARYGSLKDAAWAGVLRSANVTSRLSSKAQKRVESEFDQIKKLEFTAANIYGFLCGVVDNQAKIQIDMACDLFDEITRYHTDNTVFFKGWKSNDKHRTAGMRIKTTRFILPRNPCWCNSLDWDSMQRLRDFDKVFAMLDGKAESEVSLESLFSNCLNQLRTGTRLSSSYFDVRYFQGAQTIHFFPRDKKLIDRFNRWVGIHRQWLPPEGTRVSEDFWLQYDKAEKFDKEIREQVNNKSSRHYGDPLAGLFSNMEENRESARKVLGEALDSVLSKHGISVNFQVEYHGEQQPKQLALLAA